MNRKDILLTIAFILLILVGCNNSQIEETQVEDQVDNSVIVEEESDENLDEIMMEDIETKLLEGYEESSIHQIKEMIDFDIVEPEYLPKRFEKYGMFIKENPGMPELKMINQLWYDLKEREVFMVTQMEGAPKSTLEEEIVFVSSLESGGNISDIYSWAKNSGRYEFIQDGVLVQGYMLLDTYEIEEAEKILKSLNTREED